MGLAAVAEPGDYISSHGRLKMRGNATDAHARADEPQAVWHHNKLENEPWRKTKRG